MSGVVIAETVRRQLGSVFIMAFLALLAIIGLGASRSQSPAVIWPTFASLLAIVVGSGLIGPEFSSGTLQLILVKPLSRSSYVLSRVAGAVLVAWIGIAIAASCELLGRLLWEHGHDLDAVGIAALHGAMRTVLICALLAFFGTFTRAYFNVGIYFFLQIGIETVAGMLGMIRQAHGGIFGAFGAFVATHPEISKGLTWVGQNLFPDPPPRIEPAWLVMVASNAAVALLLACLMFRRREVPYGAD
ncbi:MAG: family transporter protein [Acidobacteriota bacterium]|jgi:ABC-type transport system involved in multi-copper enzyme maturation permease subunit|nr:family transporter protein [Acidobacteriota bacterium]